MGVNLDVPGYVREWLDYWHEALRLWDWEIRLYIALNLADSETCRGLTEVWSDVSMGRIGLRADIENTEEWEQTFVHEMLHVKHGRVDDMVYRGLAPYVGGVPNDMIERVYKSTLEPYIDSMAVALVRMRRATLEKKRQKK